MGDCRLDAGGIGNIKRNDMCCAASGVELRPQFLEPLDTARSQHDLRSGLRKHFCETRAQAAGCAGYQGGLALKIEFDCHLLLLYLAVSRSIDGANRYHCMKCR